MELPKMGIVYHAARAELLKLEPNVSPETLTWLNNTLRDMFDLGVSVATKQAVKRQGGTE